MIVFNCFCFESLSEDNKKRYLAYKKKKREIESQRIFKNYMKAKGARND